MAYAVADTPTHTYISMYTYIQLHKHMVLYLHKYASLINVLYMNIHYTYVCMYVRMYVCICMSPGSEPEQVLPDPGAETSKPPEEKSGSWDSC